MPSAPSAQNPFRSPSPEETAAPATSSVAYGLGVASTVIMTCGVIYLLLAIVAVPLSIQMYRTVSSDTDSYGQPAFYLESALKAIVYEIAYAVLGGLLVYAGWSIRKRKNYWVSVIGSIAGCLPLPLVLVSFFPSVWALWKLSRPVIRGQFVTQIVPPDGDS
ncbi:hypothetical protein AB1L30_19110 [Bremerella sp. JC817]|uniref:hypothetical protein n=1 Tax=Bremerella sp. JC817 TaxID=3231756 RepID=UPI0034598A26